MAGNRKIVKSDSGRRIRIEGLIRAGGQGEAYWATDTNSGQKGVLKLFHTRFANNDTVKRLKFLIDQDLATACRVLCAPTDLIVKGSMVGHYTPLAPGQSLEDFLVNPSINFVESLQLAITLAVALSVMHKRQIAHGDLHADNLIINRVGSVIELYVIDLDNFNAPGLPGPPMVGQNLYLAPELRESLANKRPAVPDIFTDRFSLGVLMHEITLMRHVAAGADESEVEFQKAMCSGRWLQDPAASDRLAGNQGGYPVEVLNADLARLFRCALSLNPAERPAPDTWQVQLASAFESVYCCPNCGCPCVVDVSKTACPLCRRPFPHLNLHISSIGRSISLMDGATVVGRVEVGGSMKTSSRHAIFRRIGPETWIEPRGTNGTYRWNGSGWTKLPDRRPLLVQNGDRLRFADVEAQLIC